MVHHESKGASLQFVIRMHGYKAANDIIEPGAKIQLLLSGGISGKGRKQKA